MNAKAGNIDQVIGGIHIQGATTQEMDSVRRSFLTQLSLLGLDQYVNTHNNEDANGDFIVIQLRDELASDWTPDYDTTQLCQKLDLDTHRNSLDLEREILLALLRSPVPFKFPSYAELASAVRIRKNIVAAARKTSLAFDTEEAERPESCWTYIVDCGFILRPDQDMIAALKKATQPDESGKRYSFSCYRASEYVILLGIAQELSTCNPELFGRLQRQCEKNAIQSGEFHDVFLREYGSMTQPLPLKYWVPGDRTWFRNPDNHSSDVTGYEGSWVLYLGDGLFTNFWKSDEPYNLTSKCVELFHWRNATYRDQTGELHIDEKLVDQLVCNSMNEPNDIERILRIMMRPREPHGIYVDGGCIDTTREAPRFVCPGTSDLMLPRADE